MSADACSQAHATACAWNMKRTKPTSPVSSRFFVLHDMKFMLPQALDSMAYAPTNTSQLCYHSESAPQSYFVGEDQGQFSDTTLSHSCPIQNMRILPASQAPSSNAHHTMPLSRYGSLLRKYPARGKQMPGKPVATAALRQTSLLAGTGLPANLPSFLVLRRAPDTVESLAPMA